MKKIISIILSILFFTLCMFGCNKSNTANNTTTTTESKIILETLETTSENPSNISSNENTEYGGGEILPQKYRTCYYQIPSKFSLLVDKEKLEKWEEEIYSDTYDNMNQMVIKRFVKDFNISREDFDKANNEDALIISQKMNEVPVMNPKDYINQEAYEVFNADIIYSFDDEIINEYYLSHPYPYCFQSEYEKAVLEGTYKTQTTDFFFPEIDSHSSPMLRGYEYSEEASVEPATENINDR